MQRNISVIPVGTNVIVNTRHQGQAISCRLLQRLNHSYQNHFLYCRKIVTLIAIVVSVVEAAQFLQKVV